MGLELIETVGAGSKKSLSPDLKEKIEQLKALGWEFELDHKKNIYSAKLVVETGAEGEEGRGETEVEFDSNASVDNLLLRIDRYYEDIEAENPESLLDDAALEEEEEDPGKPRKELPKTAVEPIRVELTEQELLQRSFGLSTALDDQQRTAAEYAIALKRLKTDHEEKMSAISQRVTKYHNAVSTRSEYRNVECILEWNFANKEVKTINPNTGEVVKRRNMTYEECQMELFD